MPDPATYRLTLSYRGEGYAGWQRQANAVAVQEVLERALEELIGEPVRTVGAGRTDAGVHARGQVASLTLSGPWPASALVHGTNLLLPEDIRVLAAAPAPEGFDARKHAAAKEYRYRLLRVPVLSPLDALTAVRYEGDLDFPALERATSLLPGRHDFTAFANSGGGHRDPHRRVFEAQWRQRGEELVLRIVGDGFLRGMVRALVGTLVEIARGRRAEASLAQLLEGRSRAEAGPTAPARGLELYRVRYPEPWGGEEDSR